MMDGLAILVPSHHLDALRLRAIENERPFIRVATTGYQLL
ncbi:MAG: hypothetical protein CM15mP93_15310 [Thiotrichaceae bacterium]|nr:MAG: hypothetical protein CM15mP93_15310 [Thiotrichaceae bacterium]